MIDLAAIKARCAVATPGPWEADGTELFVYQSREWIGECCRLDDPRADRDTTFIAHARTDVPALVAEVELLRAALWRAPEDWLKGDDEAWFALTGERP